MPNRTPPGIRRAEPVILAILAIAGALAFAWRFPALQPSAQVEITTSRADATRIAEAYLQEMGYHTVELNALNVSFRRPTASHSG